MRCEQCGTEFEAQRSTRRFCSDVCRQAWRMDNPQYEYVCKHCGQMYRTPYRERNQYCSRECAYLAHERQSLHAIRICIVHVCEDCGDVLPVKARRLINRCVECMREKARCDTRIWDAAKKGIPIYECKECGVKFEAPFGFGRRNFCTDKCSKRHARRIRRSRIRAGDKGAGGYDTVDPIAVCIDDDWHCYICGCPTPRKLRGTLASNAPEIDHVTPLALGGQHTRENLRCVCRSCNQRKSDRLLEDVVCDGRAKAVQVALW